MLFNSLEFALFLAIVLVVYFLLIPRRAWRARKTFLVLASYVFYMSWNPAFGLLLATSTLLDYWVGRQIDRTTVPARRRALLTLSVVVNLGILAFFKYGDFLADSAVALLRPLVGPLQSPALNIALPVGISFYTFESLSYSIDVFRGMPAYRSLLDFALFLSFFPHLVAGPIVRPGWFLPQLARAPAVTADAVEMGVARVMCGLVKKVLIADTLGQYVDRIFAYPEPFGAGNVLLAIYAYAFQIYCDFSGYTDMAIGLAMLFGLRLPENFDRPYLATNPREFWQRWHISLSTWLRDYLYVPLGGNRVSSGRTYVNLVITMLLGGLWHGASWTFVVWGAYHGALLAVHRALFGTSAHRSGAVTTALKRLGMFHLVCLGWVLFRAPTISDAWTMVSRLGSFTFLPFRDASVAAALLIVAVALHVGPQADAFRRAFLRLPPAVQGLGYAVAAVLVFLFSPGTERFIYFQF